MPFFILAYVKYCLGTERKVSVISILNCYFCNMRCFVILPIYVISTKKTRLEGVKTVPTAFQIRRRPSHQAEKTPEPPPHPYTVAFRRPSENWAGAPQCFGYGIDEGIFLTSA